MGRISLDFTPSIRKRDIASGKIYAAVGYVFFFVPVIMQDDNQFSRFHANQSLINLILSTLGGTLLSLVPRLGLFLLAGMELFCLFNLFRGIVSSLKGQARGIPFFGRIAIIPYHLPGQ